jgi:DNA helicase-2/ATP-dependent DNA helicase PcrA
MAGRLMDTNRKLKIAYKLSSMLKCELTDLTRLSSEQMEYIHRYIKDHVFLRACPGSGKTEVIGLKASYEISKWQEQNIGGLAVLTFTNSAAKELNNRIRKYSELTIGTHPHFIGTFDSWLHNFLLHPFCHYLTAYKGKDGDKSIRIIEQDSGADFMYAYQFKVDHKGKKVPVKATEYHFKDNWKTVVGDTDIAKSIISRGLTTTEFEEFKTVKTKFIKDGFATYSDAEFLCCRLLTKFKFLTQKIALRFPVIIVDECQDLSEDQLTIIDILQQKGTIFHFVGDINQAIYEFRDVNPELLMAYIQKKKFLELKLTKNYRSNQSIVDLTSLMIGNSDIVQANIGNLIPAPCILWQYDDQSFSDLPTKFEELILKHSLTLNQCVILARGKSTLDPLRVQNQNNKYTKIELFAIALHCWNKQQRNTDELTNALLYAGKFFFSIAYGGHPDVKNQYCPDGIDPVEWRLLLKRLLDEANVLYPFKANGVDMTWKNWVVLVKQFLMNKWFLLKYSSVTYDKIKNGIKSPDNKGDKYVHEIHSFTNLKNPFRTTTIHSVKGETLEAVLLISHKNKQSKGGHHSHWFREGNFTEEHIRFAYVACSRPKHLLVIATPMLSATELTQLKKIGLVP